MSNTDRSSDYNTYWNALLKADASTCLRTARRIAAGPDGLQRLYLEFVQPSQVKIGELWESGQVSVAVEHLVTAINNRVISSVYAPPADAVVDGPRMVMTCTPGEYHVLGARMAADLLEINGWSVDFIGATLPRADLIDYIASRKPVVLGISVAMESRMDCVRTTITQAKKALGDTPLTVIVGGQAFRQSHEAWRALGADLWARDALHAVTILDRVQEEVRAAA